MLVRRLVTILPILQKLASFTARPHLVRSLEQPQSPAIHAAIAMTSERLMEQALAISFRERDQCHRGAAELSSGDG
jgi:hypothetical protein